MRLAVGVERAGAKLVLVGDQRQLSAIGPGGAIDALLKRHPEIVTTVDENVRQANTAERAALAELRAGSVPARVDWYPRTGHPHLAPPRPQALPPHARQWAPHHNPGH